ncbi:MAG: metal-dependent transcriptional regulator [Oscillospiraceae bacterium]
MEKLTPSQQDYLETILDLSLDDKGVRSIDIATAFGFSRASVNKAIQSLKAEEYIRHEHYGQITLTEKGRLAAKAVRERHNLLKNFLMDILGVEEKSAEEDACKMEHIISAETLQKLEKFTTDCLKDEKIKK